MLEAKLKKMKNISEEEKEQRRRMLDRKETVCHVIFYNEP
jgi:hypothetical protein